MAIPSCASLEDKKMVLRRADNLTFNSQADKVNCGPPVLVNGHLKCTGHFTLVSINLTMLIPLGHDIFDLFGFRKMQNPSCEHFAGNCCL